MAYSIMRIPKNQQALFGQYPVHVLIASFRGNTLHKLAFHAEPQGVHSAFAAGRPARLREKAVVIAAAPSEPSSFPVKGKAGNQDKDRRPGRGGKSGKSGKIGPRKDGRLRERRRIGLPYAERTPPPGTGGGGRPVKGKFVPLDAGNEEIFSHRKSRLKKRPRVYFVLYGKKKKEGINGGPQRGSQKRFQGPLPPSAEFPGGNGRKTAFYAPPQAVFVS
jgi:hypothetical protein